MEKIETIVKVGKWLYDGIAPKGVVIKSINYDYWHDMEKADGFDNLDEPELNENGLMYMIEWMNEDFTKQESLTVGKLQLNETLELVETIVAQKINWES